MTRLMPVFTCTLLAAISATAVSAEAFVGRHSKDVIRERVVDLVNEARSESRRCGKKRFRAVKPLSASRNLDEAASRHARDMARKGFFDHRAPDGSQPWDRVRRAGYQARISGENIAYGPESAEEVVAGWLASPGHCENIMEPRFEHIGVGVATGGRRGRIYWVQNFGAPLRERSH